MNRKSYPSALFFNKLFAVILCLLWIGINGCSSGGGSNNGSETEAAVDKRQNILLIVADDMGYSDLGAYGGEINTPTLDTLAGSGIQMTNFYANPVCSPTRAALMSGTDSHVAGVGTMFEARLIATPEQLDSDGYAGYLLPTVDAFPRKLQEAGYHTYMTGKWHLANVAGGLPETIPAARGFEKSFALIQGGGSHYADALNPIPSPIPVGVKGHSQYVTYVEDQTIGQKPPAGFYSTTYYTDKMIEYIESNKGDGKPFFAYVAYTAPHWPLQLPLEALEPGNPWQQKFAAYEQQYAAGYDVIRKERLARMKRLGIIDRAIEPNSWDELNGGAGLPAWESLTPAEQQYSAREMAIYAVMVEYMDYQIGRLLEHLDLSNTRVVFMSDNGAEAADDVETLLGGYPIPQASLDEWEALMREAAGTEDYNSYDNLGRPGSQVFYGRPWARVSATPFRLFKATTAEGGIRVPMIASYPGTTSAGAISNAFATVMDLAPTFIQAAQADNPQQELRGESMESFLSGDEDEVHSADFGVGWEIWDGRAYIENGYKVFVQTSVLGAEGDGKTWEMFDLVLDPSETHNLIGDPAYEGMFDYLRDQYDNYADEVGVIPGIPAP
ncbi:MAG: arylsulfatase [Pseudomonadota bacterium]